MFIILASLVMENIVYVDGTIRKVDYIKMLI